MKNYHFSFVLTVFIGLACVFGLSGCVSETKPDSPATITEHLILLLQDPQVDTRRTAALSLGKISDPHSIPALLAALSDQDDSVRQWSVWALGNLSESLSQEVFLALIQLITDPSESVRQAVVLALAQTTIPQETLQILAQAYDISTPDTQLTIVQTLAQFDYPVAHEVFLKATKSSKPLVRQTAISGLGELGDPRGIPVMHKHLIYDSDTGVRSEAAFRLGKLGGPSDLPALRKARETDSSPTVHFWATWSMAQIDQET